MVSTYPPNARLDLINRLYNYFVYGPEYEKGKPITQDEILNKKHTIKGHLEINVGILPYIVALGYG